MAELVASLVAAGVRIGVARGGTGRRLRLGAAGVAGGEGPDLGPGLSAVGGGAGGGAGRGPGGGAGWAVLDLSLLRRVCSVDLDAGLVTMGAGIDMASVDRRLAGLGVALDGPGPAGGSSLGAAVATGAHGSGVAHGSIASQVRALEIVTADGEIRRCHAERDPDLFAAARVGLGALGVVTAVTVAVVPGHTLAVEEGDLPLDELLATLDVVLSSADHVEWRWVPGAAQARVRRARRTTAPSPVGRTLRSLALRAGASAPRPSPARVDRSYRVLASPRRRRAPGVEHALPLDALAAAVGALATLAPRPGAGPRPAAVEVRVGPAEDAWLSPAQGRPTAYVRIPAGPLWWAAGASEVLDGLGGRPSWGDAHGLGAADLAPRYPMWGRWQALRRALDPGGVWVAVEPDEVLAPPQG